MQYTPPAVPLDICLQNIYTNDNSTDFEVDVAVKILQSLIKNNGEEKFRSLNATKVLPRLSTSTSLALWYIMRHAGFIKDGDRLVCPTSVPLSQTQDVLTKLLNLTEHHKKIQSGEIQVQPVISSKPVPMSKSNDTEMLDSSARALTPVSPQPTSQEQSIISQNNDSMSDSVTLPPNNASNESTTSPKPANVLGGKSVKDMTPEERKAYVAEMMRAKKNKQ